MRQKWQNFRESNKMLFIKFRTANFIRSLNVGFTLNARHKSSSNKKTDARKQEVTENHLHEEQPEDDLGLSPHDHITNKVALITGGATITGYHYARELLKCGAGAVMIADLDETCGRKAITDLASQFGPGKLSFIRANVSDPAELENAFEKTVETWGEMHIVVNNAGILDERHWEDEIEINCTGLARSTLLSIEYMGHHNGGNGGTVVNLCSILAFEKPASCPLRVATEYFIIGLGAALGRKANFERTGVRVLTICPGIMMSGMIHNLHLKGMDLERGLMLEREIGELRIQPPEDVAEGLVKVLRLGAPGSLWVAEAGKLVYEVKPKRKQSEFIVAL